MKQFNKQLLKSLFVLPCLISMGVWGQSREKIITEEFMVDDNVVIEINTSYTDLEFDTWNKNKVEVIATVQIEGASDLEFQEYMENSSFEIFGNSSKVKILNKGESGRPIHFVTNAEPIVIEIPDLPSVENFEFDFDFSAMENLPEMPPIPSPKFDYEAFKKDGEAYMKEWQENFEKDFAEPYQERMKEWQEKMAEKRKKVEEKRVIAMEKRAEKMEEARVKRLEAHQKRMEAHHQRIAEQNAKRAANTFYVQRGSQPKKFKVSKSIKIKMPKSAKIKMDVRHGEVKLAERIYDINASLSYSNLKAKAIDGTNSLIVASYSPVSVETWQIGELRARYSRNVDLKEVVDLNLEAKSSEVFIKDLIKRAKIKNDFGPISINNVSSDFEDVQMDLSNAEIELVLPETAHQIAVNISNSSLNYPKTISMHKNSKNGQIQYVGQSSLGTSEKRIHIDSSFSEILLK